MTIMTELELLEFINNNDFGIGFEFNLETGTIVAVDDLVGDE